MKIPSDLSDRLESFAADVIKGVPKINKTFAGRHIAGQLMSFSHATIPLRGYSSAQGSLSRMLRNVPGMDFHRELQIQVTSKGVKKISFLAAGCRKGRPGYTGGCSSDFKRGE